MAHIFILLSLFASIFAQDHLPSTQVSTCGWFHGVIGGFAVSYCGTSCSQASAPSKVTPICDTRLGNSDTQVRWGKSTSDNPYDLSGLGFTGEKSKTVALNQEFYCGRLTHFNFHVLGPANAARLGIQLLIPEFDVDQTFNYKLNIDETNNNDTQSPCPYPSIVPCSDKITFDIGGSDFGKKFKINGVDYTLQLTGFKESNDSNSFSTQNFISNEESENDSFLFCRIVAGCPQVCPNGARVQLLIENGAKTCGCNCDGVSCKAPFVLQKDCGCKCPVGTCNGAPIKPGTCDCDCPTPSSANQVCNFDNKTEWDSTTCQCVHPEKTTPCGSTTCPVPHDTCTQYECNEEQSTCTMTTSPDGAACGVTGSDPSTWDMCAWQCETGVCRYDEVSCDAYATAMGMTLQQADPFTCDQFGCNPKNGRCELGPKPGKKCNDMNECTINDTCQINSSNKLVCIGEMKECVGELEPCHEFQCNPKSGKCTSVLEQTPCPATMSTTIETSSSTSTTSSTSATSSTSSTTTSETTSNVDVKCENVGDECSLSGGTPGTCDEQLKCVILNGDQCEEVGNFCVLSDGTDGSCDQDLQCVSMSSTAAPKEVSAAMLSNVSMFIVVIGVVCALTVF